MRSLALESGIELKDSGILLTIGIRRPSSDNKESRIHGAESNAVLRACLHGGEGPQIGEETCDRSPHLSYKRERIKMRDYMDRRVTPPKRVTRPTWGPPPPCKQAFRFPNMGQYFE